LFSRNRDDDLRLEYNGKVICSSENCKWYCGAPETAPKCLSGCFDGDRSRTVLVRNSAMASRALSRTRQEGRPESRKEVRNEVVHLIPGGHWRLQWKPHPRGNPRAPMMGNPGGSRLRELPRKGQKQLPILARSASEEFEQAPRGAIGRGRFGHFRSTRASGSLEQNLIRRDLQGLRKLFEGRE